MVNLLLFDLNGEAVKNRYPDSPQLKVETILIHSGKKYIIVVDGNGKEYQIMIAT